MTNPSENWKIRFTFKDGDFNFGCISANSMKDAIDKAALYRRINKNILSIAIFDGNNNKIEV